ncbi:MAG: hypothetical protein NVSMB57_00030 [Actinomycetota bacterium]
MRSATQLVGSSWPEADALFRSDPRFLGTDDAYSVPLSSSRTLWLFGDSFIGDGVNTRRESAAFIRNSIGIMEGQDPASATISFHWKPGPEAFFAVEGPTWLWPLHGARAGGALLLFFMLVRPAQEGGTGGIEEWREHGIFGFFNVFGWTAIRVENPDDDPQDWRSSFVAPMEPSRVVLGASAIAHNEWLYMYGWDEAMSIYVARISLDLTDAHPFESLQWWDGHEWGRHHDPVPVADEGTTEFTVHRLGGRFCMTAIPTAEPRSLAMRWASRPEGPWSPWSVAFTPEESPRADAFAYAGKAHPQLKGADIVATYASIAACDITLKDDSLYYPRFVRLQQKTEGAE